MSEEFEPKVTGCPDEIWLIYGESDEDCKHDDCYDVSWCQDQQFNSDVCYVRADIAEAMQAKLDAQSEELAALRGFALDINDYLNVPHRKSELFESLAIRHGLIDGFGNPTPLLTGAKE